MPNGSASPGASRSVAMIPIVLRVETAQREGQGLGGGTVDPLHIVDRNDDRLGSGHGLERS